MYLNVFDVFASQVWGLATGKGKGKPGVGDEAAREERRDGTKLPERNCILSCIGIIRYQLKTRS